MNKQNSTKDQLELSANNQDIDSHNGNENYLRKKISEEIKKTKITDLVTVFATVVIMVATTVYSFIALKQWKVMERQTDASFQQLSIAKDSIKIASDSLEESRKSASEQSNRAERITIANEQIAQISKNSVETAQEVAKKSLDATIENFRLEQRAWIGPMALKWDDYIEGKKKVHIKEGEQFKVGVNLINSGKTPAFNVKAFIIVTALKQGEKPDPQKRQEDELLHQTNAVMQPGGTFGLDNISANFIPSKNQIESLSRGERVIHLFGKIIYEDVFDQQHFTKFCMFLHQDLASFSGCPYYNETDDQIKHN